MRVLVFFDLPSVSSEERREYRQFHRHLVRSGFMMLQESVYCKLALNATAVHAIMANLRKNKPPRGSIQTLVVTEKQFARSELILGEFQSEIINSDERLVIL